MINRPRFRVRYCTYKNLVFNVVCYFITLEYDIITIRLEGTQSCLLFIRVMLKQDQKKTECVVKTHDRSETFVLQGNIVIIHQSLLNSIFTTKLYILMKKINYKQR
jgi:hypothetical protein